MRERSAVFKRLLLLFVCCCISGGTALADPTTKPAAAAAAKVAPADVYFGRLKMSVLGIQNVIKDMRLRVEADAERTPSIFGGLANVEDAIRDWEAKFPHDSWIPKDLLALEIAYLAAPGERAHAMAIKVEAWLRHDFKKTRYAFEGHNLLQKSVVTAMPVPPQAIAPVTIQATNATAPDPASAPAAQTH